MAFRRQLHQAKCEFRTTNHACSNFAQQPKHVRIPHQQPMHVRISHQPMRLWCKISSVLQTPHQIFSFVFFYVNSFLILVISHSQALLCKKTIRGVEIISRKIYCIFYTQKNFPLGKKYRVLFAFLFSLLFSFSWKPNNL